MDSKQYLLLAAFTLSISGLQAVSAKTYNLTIQNKTGKNGSGWGGCRIDVECKDSNKRINVPRGKSAKLEIPTKTSTLIVKTSKGSWEFGVDFARNRAVLDVTSKDFSEANTKWINGAKFKGRPKKIL